MRVACRTGLENGLPRRCTSLWRKDDRMAGPQANRRQTIRADNSMRCSSSRRPLRPFVKHTSFGNLIKYLRLENRKSGTVEI